MEIEVKENYEIKNLTTFKVGGNVKQIYFPANQQEFVYLLKTIKSDNFMLSHKTPFAMPKEAVIGWLESIYSKRKKNESYVSM